MMDHLISISVPLSGAPMINLPATSCSPSADNTTHYPIQCSTHMYVSSHDSSYTRAYPSVSPQLLFLLLTSQNTHTA